MLCCPEGALRAQDQEKCVAGPVQACVRACVRAFVWGEVQEVGLFVYLIRKAVEGVEADSATMSGRRGLCRNQHFHKRGGRYQTRKRQEQAPSAPL